MYKVLDLFSGAGGLSLGFMKANNFNIKLAIEKHPDARKSYEINHENVEVLSDILDITDFKKFNNDYGDFDVIIGGPPCQGFSNANRQKFDFLSSNNSLVKKYVEFVLQIKPKAFVMENVIGFKSDKHLFYLSRFEDEKMLTDCLKEEKISIYSSESTEELKKMIYITSNFPSTHFLFDERLLRDLIYVMGKSNDLLKLKDILNRNTNSIINKIKEKKIEFKESLNRVNDSTNNKFLELLDELTLFIYDHEKNLSLIPKIEKMLDIQKTLYTIDELNKNQIIYNGIDICGNNLVVNLQSITVKNYLFKMLEKDYEIKDEVLNAAWYGAPQTRKRYIALGFRKDLLNPQIKVGLPDPIFNESEYRRIGDAIKDLENIEPQYVMKQQPIVFENLKGKKGTLLETLRDTNLLYNHISTQSKEHIKVRFSKLKPGQNFHDLSPELVDNYSNPSKTQNSIYRRLDYNETSPTVTNVRKAMWIHPTKHRAISIREAARLQTFPDSFIFVGTKDAQYQQVGNAVPPILAEAIANELLKMLNKTL